MTAVVGALARLLRLGAVADLVSKPVMTGFLFGLGLTIMVGQLPKVLGVAAGDADFFEQAWTLLGDLGDVHAATVAVGAASVAVLLIGPRLVPRFPATLLILILAIGASALLDLKDHGVDVVGDLPSALPDPGLPDVGAGDVVELIGAAFGVLLVSAEGIGVARSLATLHGDRFDVNRDLLALGGSNLLAGLVRLRPVRRRQPDRGRRGRRREVAARVDRRGRAGAAHGGVPGAAVRGPAAGDARRDRRGRRLPLPAGWTSPPGSAGSAAARSPSRWSRWSRWSAC